MAAKIGDAIHSLPVDSQQDFPHMDMNFIDEYVKSTKLKSKTKSKNKKEKFIEPEPEPESDSDSDSGSDTEPDTEAHKPSVMSELKTTFLASLIFVILSLDIVNATLNTLGIDGIKLLIVKFFIFASIYFVVRYKFM